MTPLGRPVVPRRVVDRQQRPLVGRRAMQGFCRRPAAPRTRCPAGSGAAARRARATTWSTSSSNDGSCTSTAAFECVEDVGDLAGREAGVHRHQRHARPRHPEVGLQHHVRVRCQHGHRPAVRHRGERLRPVGCSVRASPRRSSSQSPSTTPTRSPCAAAARSRNEAGVNGSKERESRASGRSVMVLLRSTGDQRAGHRCRWTSDAICAVCHTQAAGGADPRAPRREPHWACTTRLW